MITSKSNEKIKYINSLKNKKFRDKYSKYILEGIKLVDEHISSEDACAPEFIVICKNILLNNAGGESLYNKIYGIKKYEKCLLELDENVFKFVTDTETPQGILIVLDKKDTKIADLVTRINNKEKIIVLDKVADAGNLGTIIRTAVSFGVKNIICIKGTTDVYSNKVVRSAMGAIDKVDTFYMDVNELSVLKEVLKENEYKMIATDLKGKKYLNECDVKANWIYVLGNEANGVSDEIKALCDEYIKIPMENIQESLNVGIAAAILMYEMYVRGDNSAS